MLSVISTENCNLQYLYRTEYRYSILEYFNDDEYRRVESVSSLQVGIVTFTTLLFALLYLYNRVTFTTLLPPKWRKAV